MCNYVNGMYLLTDDFYALFSKYNLKYDKDGRPYYIFIKIDNGDYYWAIPCITSNIETYKQRIADYEKENRRSNIFYVTKNGAKETVLSIGEMIPVKETHIQRAFTISGIPCIVKDEHDIKEITIRAKAVLAQLMRGKRFHKKAPDVLEMIKILCDERS